MGNENLRQRRDDDSDTGGRVAYLLIGAGVGAILALLFAPKSGHELRSDIADATRKGIDRTRETATQLGSRAGEYYEATRERASQLYDTASERAGELAGAAREAATRRGGQFSAALEAGKQAYRDEKRRTELSGETDAAPTYYEKE